MYLHPLHFHLYIHPFYLYWLYWLCRYSYITSSDITSAVRILKVLKHSLSVLLFPAAALHAGLCGALPAGSAHLPLPGPQPGDPLHLLPGGVHHPSLPQPRHLRLQGRAVPQVLGPLPGLLGPSLRPLAHQATEAVAEGQPVGGTAGPGQKDIMG